MQPLIEQMCVQFPKNKQEKSKEEFFNQKFFEDVVFIKANPNNLYQH